MKTSVELPNGQLGFLLVQTSWLKQRINSSAFKGLNVTYVQFVILAGILELGVNNQIVTQQTIVAERRLDKAMVSSVVKTLLQKKMITKMNHPSDHRAMILALTQEGERIARKGKEIAKHVDAMFFDHIDKEILRGVLEKLLNENK
ncbi:MAG: MarR family winged helix-turn-helix transcriptional regulator [Breznakibacter sp.]